MLSLVAQLHVMLDKYYYPGGMLWGMLSLNLLSGQISICAVTNNTAHWNSLSINTAHCASSPLRLLMTSVALICPHRDVRVSLSVRILCPRAPLFKIHTHLSLEAISVFLPPWCRASFFISLVQLWSILLSCYSAVQRCWCSGRGTSLCRWNFLHWPSKVCNSLLECLFMM